MSKVNEINYRYQVCPHCKSKRIRPVGVVRMNTSQWQAEITQVNRTGYMCDNCNRYIIMHKLAWFYDRAEMRRDIKGLQEFLNKE